MVFNNLDSGLHKMVHEMKEELLHLMDYWIYYATDIEHEGFLGERSFDNQIVPDADKGFVLNARILWSFSAAYNHSGNIKYLDQAHRAYNYIIKFFWDKTYGGFFWSLNKRGDVVSSRKQIYAQGFAIYGLSEYYKATNNKTALEYAIETFNLIEEHSFDAQNGGYIEALAMDWSALEDMRLSEKDANTPKSMNTHLHILEPYTNLYRVWKDDFLKQKIVDLLNVFTKRILNPETYHYHLFFDTQWNVLSNIISYGHDIEGSWLMAEAAYETGNSELISQMEEIAVKMVDVTIDEGMDKHGAVFNEKHNEHLDTDKHWWPQAETMVGLTYAWKITRDEKYLVRLMKTWIFITNYIIDKENGEWHWRVDDDGKPYTNEVKLGFWKCPYHNSRALMEIITILENY